MSFTGNRQKTFWSYAGLFLVAFIWGSAFVVVKNALDHVPPAYMVAIRFSIAAVVMLIIFGRRLKGSGRDTIVHGLLIGFFLFTAYLVQTIGCNYTTAGKNAFLTAIYIIIVPFIHWAIDRKKPANRLFLAAFTGLIGIGLISLDGDLSIGFGDMMTILCGFLFAMQIAFQDNYVKKDDPAVICLLEMVVCAVGGWICAPFIDGKLPVTELKSLTIIGSMLFLGLISSLVCQLLQSVCQKYTKPENASLIMSSESVFGAVCSMIFLHERMRPRVLLGCVIMACAILLSQIRFKNEKNTK